MATITSDTYLDGGTARTAGETWTINGGILTIRTDTRWHANAPASMTGSLGSATISATLGGGILLDATNVREVAFDTGSGNVPAIGTSITQGGVTGYLLGVYANLTSAPTAVGAAMPTTGFIKFRELDGALSAGALTGIGANATGADTTSWIEVVFDQATAVTVPRLGFFRARGDWYTLPQTTDGTTSQVIQIPTNGGGTGTRVPCVWIETGAGSGTYEKYPAVSSTYFSTTNLGTDERSKFVLMDTNGTVRIGGNGVNTIGFLPETGCKIIIPNILGRQTTSAGGRANNQVPHATLATRPDFTTTSGGDIDCEYLMDDWYHLFTAAYQVRFINSATMDIHTTSAEASPTTLNNYVAGIYQAGSITFTATNNALGGTITDCSFYRPDAASNGHSFSMTGCSNYVFEGTNETGIITYARSTGLISFSQCRNFDINGVFYAVQETVTPSTSFNFDFELVRYIDRLTGTTNTTTGKYAVTCLVSSDNIVVNIVDFGGYANLHPYLGVFNASNCSNLKLRIGNTSAGPIGGSTNAPANIFVDSGNNDTIKVQNCFLTATRTGLYTTVNTSKNITFERVAGTTGSTATASVNTLGKGLRSASNSVTGQASVYGTHFFDMFESDTAGRVWLAMNEPTASTLPYITLTLAGATGGFTSGGQVSMPTVGDELIAEMPYYALGHTAFDNSAPTLTGANTGNFSYEYDLDVNDGNGFTGSYQTLDGTNLSAETIDPVLGFKLRFRITCTTGATTNALTYVRISTDSTLSDQDTAAYPLETATPTLTLTGIEIGSEVVIYNGDYSTELDRQVTTGDYTYNYEWNDTVGDFSVNILIWKDDKAVYAFGNSMTSADQSIPITQTEDLVYQAATSAPVTFDYANTTIIMDTAATEYSVPEVYSSWKDDMLLSSNFQYAFAFSQIGGNPTGGANSVPFYTFINGTASWKVRPDEADHTLNVTDGILVSNDSTDPFVDTLGAYTVRINYQQPVQAIAVTTGGGGGATAADVWSYATRRLSATGISDITTGLATETNATTNKDSIITILNALNDIAPSDVLTQATSALTTYDPPTKAELDSAIAGLNDISTADVLAQTTSALNTYDSPTKTEMDTAFSTLNDISPAEVNAEIDTALADYDPPTKTEMDTAIGALNDISTDDVWTDPRALTRNKFIGLK